MTVLEVTQLTKTYGHGPSAVHAVGNLSFRVEPGEFVCIVGQSGCGKTTLLKCLCGLIPATSGTAVLQGRVIDRPPDKLALVFQEYSRSLLPWMTVRGNITLPLRSKGIDSTRRDELAEQALTAVGLVGSFDRYPWQLSGGMQQRVAIARALAYQPEILLMDEPFASVDAQTRADLEDLVLRVRDEFDVTVLFVTHDIDEAIYLSDRVIVLTPPPTRVREVVDVDLPRPRDQIATKGLPAFTRLRAHVFELIKRPADSAGDELSEQHTT
ncbi:MAG: ABC transporter ATP-binding protein [Euzebyales bacterium]|nr:ABC transporter ATP-binding protein [Euzebyales bacterium]